MFKLRNLFVAFFILSVFAVFTTSCEGENCCEHYEGVYLVDRYQCTASCPPNTCKCTHDFCRCVGCPSSFAVREQIRQENERAKRDSLGAQIRREQEKQEMQRLGVISYLLTKGFTMQLEQIYIMSDKNSVPCADKPADSTFIGNSNVIVNLINFVYDQNPHNVIMQGLEKGEEWVFSENIKIENEPFYIEHGYGNGYFVTVGQSYTYVTIITRKTEYAYFIFEIDLNPKNNDYNYRGKDNFLIPMNVLDDESESHKTNLKLTFLTDLDGIAYQIKDGYIYLDTNRQYSIGYSVTGPLTSQQAVKIIREGVEGADWTLHIQDGMTYYRIGNNLYKPSFGNNIIYAGTIYYDNGSIQTYQSMYYRLKFKLSPSDKEFINANF